MDKGFNAAVEFVLANEGGFNDNPSDPGGATNFGISLRFLRQVPDERLKKYGIFGELSLDLIKEISSDQAKLIYRTEFWEQAPFGNIENERIRNYVFDCCVNHGMSFGIKILQRAMWAVFEKSDAIYDDGILGTLTINALDTISMSYLRTALVAERAGFVRLIAEIHPQEKDFLDGWLKRAYRI